jgi:hypothetical protein
MFADDGLRNTSLPSRLRDSQVIACIEPTPTFVTETRSRRTDELAEILIPPLNSDDVCGYRRPNMYYRPMPNPQDPASLAAADASISAKTQALGFCKEFLHHKKKGHVYQYIRAIVMQCYKHQVSSEEAMEHWMNNTSLISEKTKQMTTTSGQRKQEWTSDQNASVRQRLSQLSAHFHITFTNLIRYLIESNDTWIRDHFRTVILTSIAFSLGESPLRPS